MTNPTPEKPPEITSEVLYQFALVNQFMSDAGGHMLDANPAKIVADIRSDGTLTNNIAVDIQEEFKQVIARTFPEHAIIGLDGAFGSTEGQADPQEANDVWIINSMDAAGEFNAPRNADAPELSCAIGIGKMVANQLVFVVIYAPFKALRYHAINGQGAFVNGRKVQVGNQEVVPGNPVAYDYHSDPQSGVVFPGLLERFGPPIGEASTLLQACDVARGHSAFSAQVTNGINTGLGTLIVRQAGGVSEEAPHESLAVPPAFHVLHATPTAYESVQHGLIPPYQT